MEAFISGKAGLAIIVRGNEASVINIDNLAVETEYPVSTLRYLLAGADDTKKIQATSKAQLICSLKKEYEKNRALTMVLMLFDDNEDDETLELAIDCLNDYLNDDEVLKYIENTLFSNVMPVHNAFKRAIKYSQPIRRLFDIFCNVALRQDAISLFRNKWDSLPDILFDDPMDKIVFEELLVTNGFFKEFVLAGDDAKKFSFAQFQCLSKLKPYKNSRNVLNEWIRGLCPKKVKFPVSQGTPYPLVQASAVKRSFRPRIKPHDAFVNVVKQKKAIIPLLKKGDWEKTRRFVDDLISSQLENSELEHISKSLCDLAQHAKNVKNFSLQLELAKKATQILNDDGWAHGQVADAYICLGQFAEAIEAFRLAEIFGQYEFAKVGYARILREQGRLDESILAFEKLFAEFPESSIVGNCYAEVLRDVWRIDDALLVYDTVIEKLSCDSTTYCGKASVLKSIGRLDEALSLYEYARKLFNDSPYIGMGIADIYRIRGQFQEALDEYDKVIKQFPEESVPRCARANIYRLKNDFPVAIREFRSIAKEFPFDVTPKEGIAETLKDMKLYDDSLDSYNEILKQFHKSIRARNGRANVLKAKGQFTKSLQAYDENVKDFPYDIAAWCGRADILKQLNFFDESIAAYKRISELNPYDKSSVYSMSAIYAVIGKFNTALDLLPSTKPQSREDWIAYHIRGMIYLKSGKIDEAIDFFNEALHIVPYYAVAKYFKNALSVAHLYRKNAQGNVECVIDNGEEAQNDYISNVICIHAYGESGDVEKAKDAYKKIGSNSPPYIIRLRDQLSARYIKQFKVLQHDFDWLYEQECNGILLEAA